MMTIEASLVEKKRSAVGLENKTIRKKKKKNRKKKKKCRRTKVVCAIARSMTLQKLFVECRNAFKGPGTVPSPEDVIKLQRIIDEMKPEDVGLRSDLLFLNKHKNGVKGTPSITYITTMYQCKNFSLCLFFLPTTGIIPLHNHPGMTVFSKLLLGSMHIKSYDWVDPDRVSDDPALSPRLRLARMKADKVFTAPCDTSILYPTTGGNIHAFTAVTPCVVLDVLGPPYSSEDGRDCTYYRDFPFSSFSDGVVVKEGEGEEGYGWLEEIEMPKDSNMEPLEYRGPPIIESNYTC